jgi:polysaccharide biosynthesis protein PslH
MRVLFVAPYLPSPVRVRPYQLIRALAAAGHSVHLVALQPPEDDWAPIAPLFETCEGVDIFRMPRIRTLWNGLRALPTRRPLQAAYSHHPELERHLAGLARPESFDVVHVEHLRGAVLADGVTGLPRVFDAVDSITLLFEQAGQKAPGLAQRVIARADLARTRRFEAAAPWAFDRTVITSPLDRDALVRLAGDGAASRIAVLPNGVDTAYFRRAAAIPSDPLVLFTGKMSYHANASAAQFLAAEVMPLVWRSSPAARLAIVGKSPSPAVRALSADSRVEVTGFVDDIRPWFARASVAVAPMLYGVGIQNKILEAMASGVPVVATSRTGGSLLARRGIEFLVGDSAREISAQITRVLGDPRLRASLSTAGRLYVEAHHDWRAAAARLVSVYAEARAEWAVRTREATRACA